MVVNMGALPLGRSTLAQARLQTTIRPVKKFPAPMVHRFPHPMTPALPVLPLAYAQHHAGPSFVPSGPLGPGGAGDHGAAPEIIDVASPSPPPAPLPAGASVAADDDAGASSAPATVSSGVPKAVLVVGGLLLAALIARQVMR